MARVTSSEEMQSHVTPRMNNLMEIDPNCVPRKELVSNGLTGGGQCALGKITFLPRM